MVFYSLITSDLVYGQKDLCGYHSTPPLSLYKTTTHLIILFMNNNNIRFDEYDSFVICSELVLYKLTNVFPICRNEFNDKYEFESTTKKKRNHSAIKLTYKFKNIENSMKFFK